jgi:peptide chain release factor 1
VHERTEKVQRLLADLKTVEKELSRSDIFDSPKRYKELSQQHAYLNRLKTVWDEISRLDSEIISNKSLLNEEGNEEMIDLLNAALEEDRARLETLNTELATLLVPPDPNDNKTTIVEIRAGTGGDEAALFVADCVRMYKLFASNQGWTVEPLSGSNSDIGGFKEYVMAISGEGVHRLLQYEGGTHRVQRVPATETQGRVHTSAVTVAILIEPDDEGEVEIEEKDLRIDTFRASGAGGQHVNTTDSAVRITHVPTGIVAECQDERSQHKNKAKALRYLRARIADAQARALAAERAEQRSSQVGSGDRSERIRTYNYSQNRITDHRINLTRYNLDRVMEGDLEEILLSLVSFFHEQKLRT